MGLTVWPTDTCLIGPWREVTEIRVDTQALMSAAAHLQTLGRSAEEGAHQVRAAIRELDLEVSAREELDLRLGALSARLDAQAQELARHARFLARAASEYESAERSLGLRTAELAATAR